MDIPNAKTDSRPGLLGLDIGQRRTGIAVASRQERIAIPLKTLSTPDILAGVKAFRALLEDHAIGLLVAGLPLSLAGGEWSQAKQTRRLAQRVATLYQLPLEFVDERLSSAEARRLLRQAGYSEREMRGKADRIAASLILSTWLTANNQHLTVEQSAKDSFDASL